MLNHILIYIGDIRGWEYEMDCGSVGDFCLLIEENHFYIV